jgi:hypothetical protein
MAIPPIDQDRLIQQNYTRHASGIVGNTHYGRTGYVKFKGSISLKIVL